MAKMVLLTIVTTSNSHTLYFDHPIEKPSYVRLLSASIYNSWNNLKHRADIFYFDPEIKKTTVRSLLQGHCTLDQIAAEIQGAFTAQKVNLQTELNTPVGGMIIYNYDMANVKLGHNVSELLGIGANLLFMTYVKRLTSPSTYFIHCDLVDKRQNLVNGKPSTVLARFDLRGKPFETVHYQTTQQHVLRDTSTGDYDVNSLKISVRDENGELFDFNSMPLEFEVEIN